MDRELIESKLESLRRCLVRVRSRCPSSPEELSANLDVQDIVTLNLTRAVQLCVDISVHLLTGTEAPAPQTMGESFEGLVRLEVLEESLAVRLKRAVGFRNIVVHDYGAIDWNIVHSICTRDLDAFKAFAKAVLGYVEATGAADSDS